MLLLQTRPQTIPGIVGDTPRIGQLRQEHVQEREKTVLLLQVAWRVNLLRFPRSYCQCCVRGGDDSVHKDKWCVHQSMLDSESAEDADNRLDRIFANV